MRLQERDRELERLTALADDARAGRGGLVVVGGESGAGKTSFVEAFLQQRPSDGARVLWGACDPLDTPRPLGPIHDLAEQFGEGTRETLRAGEQPHEIYAAVFEELAAHPSVLVIDDVHWADQATVDLLRFVLRRIRRTHSLVILAVRDDEIGPTHPMRALLGDVARSASATSVALSPLSVAAIAELSQDRSVDPVRLHEITGGNAFFVVEMLDHTSDELPTTVRDAILARTVGLDVAAWDLLYLLACAPESIPDYLLTDLGVTLSSLRILNDSKLIRRNERGVTFRHDLCRLAVASVIPPGAEAQLHRRLIDAYEATSRIDPAVLTHHALEAGDSARILRFATAAGNDAARSGAHVQAAEFYRAALDRSGPLEPEHEAELLELLADEYYLNDRLDDAITLSHRALRHREQLGVATAVVQNLLALGLYESYNVNLARAQLHAARAVALLDGHLETKNELEILQLGYALVTQAYFAVSASDFAHTASLLSRVRECLSKVYDPVLAVRTDLIDGYRGGLVGDNEARVALLSCIKSAAELGEDELYAYGFSSLALIDSEQRRHAETSELLDISVPLSVERNAPFVRTWLLASRARIKLMLGDWDDAAVDAEGVLSAPSGLLVRTWPELVRAVISLRREGIAGAGIDVAWQLFSEFGDHFRLFPAAAIVEQVWLTGTSDDRLDSCRNLLVSWPGDGLAMAVGELTMWLRRIDPAVDTGRATGPYRMLFDGEFEAATQEFQRLSMPYEAALALVDSGEVELARRGLDQLDRLGAAAVAAKIRRDLRAGGHHVVPARRRSTTLANTAGLTARQVEVLRLLDDGLTNAELAERLYLSVKTVDHHVSAILTKLEVSRRRDAGPRARELGILS